MARQRKAGRSWAPKAAGRYHHGDLRRALIQASIELIAEKGVSALTLRGVARRVGVSHAASHHHFASKTELLAAVAMEGFEALAQAEREAAAATADPWDRFKAIGRAYLRFAVAHPAHFRVMFGRELVEGSQPPPEEQWVANPASRVLVEVATEAIATRGNADEERVRVAVIAAWSLVHGLAMLWLDGPLRQLSGLKAHHGEFDELARTITDFVVDAVARGL
jgi:AcrR family transcriptional regulator